MKKLISRKISKIINKHQQAHKRTSLPQDPTIKIFIKPDNQSINLK